MELINKKKIKNTNKPQQITPNTTKQNKTSTNYKKVETPVYKEYVGVKSPSLKSITLNATNKETQKELDAPIVDKTENFNQDELNNVWFDFIENIKETRKRFYQLFKNQTPKLLDDFVVQINANNKSQKQDIEEKMQKEISYFLQKRLQNNQITIKLQLQEANMENIIYGDTNIYKYLIEKNPKLQIMTDTFGLDFN